MNREDIIRLAREAGGTDRRTGWWDIHTEDLEHLVALVTERDTALLRQALKALELLEDYDNAQGMLTEEAIERVQEIADAARIALRERLGEKT